jgi:endonuclease G
LAEPVGEQALGMDHAVDGAETRGFYRLDGSPYTYIAEEPVRIVGHPGGRPAQFSYASPSQIRLTPRTSRVRYQTNTERGSSGSPVFNKEWRVIALHQAAGPTAAPGPLDLQDGLFNQGIPIAEIVAALRQVLAGSPELSELGLY